MPSREFYGKRRGHKSRKNAKQEKWCERPNAKRAAREKKDRNQRNMFNQEQLYWKEVAGNAMDQLFGAGQGKQKNEQQETSPIVTNLK